MEKLNIAKPDDVRSWDDESEELLSFLRQLWTLKSEDEFRPIIRKFEMFQIRLEKLKDMWELIAALKLLSIEVEEFDSSNVDPEKFKGDRFSLVFIDYNLGVEEGDDAISNAKDVIKKIYAASPVDKRPVVVLMSSNSNIRALAEKFRDESELIEGVFRSAPKADLVNKNRITLLAKAFEEEFSSNHSLQLYIKELIAAATVAHENFVSDIKTLKVEDYEYILNSVLKAEKQPLGDYLNWLYGSYWTNLLYRSEGLLEQQKRISKIVKDKPPLHSSMPSSKLADIFMSAVFEENLEPLATHPLHGIDEKIAKRLYLRLGDIFTRPGSTDVYIVLNPQCDLERPKDAAKDMSILLVPGSLHFLDDGEEMSTQTDFFVFEKERYRISWHLKKVCTHPLNSLPTWIKKKKLERKIRMRLPYALDLQQKFISHISRVGLPVAPPIAHELTISVKSKLFSAGSELLLKENSDYTFLTITREKNDGKVRLTLDFMMAFKDALAKKITDVRKEYPAGAGNLPKNFEQKMGQTEAFLEKIDDWFFKNREFAKPTKPSATLEGNQLSVIFETTDESKVTTPFWIVIHHKKNIKMEATPIKNDKKEVVPVVASKKKNQQQKKVIAKFEKVKKK
ncbi:MAG: hypothetical protein EOP46_00395 [Sphingobacteriaceae bacterium]|nr:MAG: hypothetical protein EOP46_00395 [Sphingobacteriaceae bacterium]